MKRNPIARCLTAMTFVIGSADALSAQQAGRDRDWLVASAVLALPDALRAGAEVRGWVGADSLVVLRPGSNDIICLADQPDEEGFAAACYHASLEPFMARGRELRRQGVDGERRNQVRWQEIEAGTLPMPVAAMVYNLSFPDTNFDPATVDAATGGRLHSLYMPGATTASTGVTDKPGAEPWLMLPGTPSAHIMIALPRKQ